MSIMVSYYKYISTINIKIQYFRKLLYDSIIIGVFIQQILQKQERLTGRLTELEQKRSFRARFGPIRPSFGPQNFFGGFNSTRYQTLLSQAAICVISRKTNDTNLTKWRKPNFRHQNFFCGFYIYQQLDIVQSYHPMQFPGKLMNKT